MSVVAVGSGVWEVEEEGGAWYIVALESDQSGEWLSVVPKYAADEEAGTEDEVSVMTQYHVQATLATWFAVRSGRVAS